jgi:hypothetical protein
MKLRFGMAEIVAVFCLVCAGCQTVAGDVLPVLICQLRVAKSVSPNPKTTRIDLVTSSGEDGHFLWGYNQKVQKEDGQFFIFEPDDFLLFTDNRRAVIIDDSSTPQQVFLLHLRRHPKKQDWSGWQRPNFFVKGDFGWAFMYKQKIQGVITNIPPNCFEMRYKVEMQNLPE